MIFFVHAKGHLAGQERGTQLLPVATDNERQSVTFHPDTLGSGKHLSSSEINLRLSFNPASSYLAVGKDCAKESLQPKGRQVFVDASGSIAVSVKEIQFLLWQGGGNTFRQPFV